MARAESYVACPVSWCNKKGAAGQVCTSCRRQRGESCLDSGGAVRRQLARRRLEPEDVGAALLLLSARRPNRPLHCAVLLVAQRERLVVRRAHAGRARDDARPVVELRGAHCNPCCEAFAKDEPLLAQCGLLVRTGLERHGKGEGVLTDAAGVEDERQLELRRGVDESLVAVAHARVVVLFGLPIAHRCCKTTRQGATGPFVRPGCSPGKQTDY
jgi:hypothetical protein